MKRIGLSLSILLLSAALCLSAQSLPTSPRALKSGLQTPDRSTGAVVTVHEPAELEALLNRTESLDRLVAGYRVRIFFDNSQTARQSANAIKARFESTFPEIPVYLFYDNPYFKVAVGDCLTKDEAIIIWGRIKNQFPNSFIVQESLPLKNFIHTSSWRETEEILTDAPDTE